MHSDANCMAVNQVAVGEKKDVDLGLLVRENHAETEIEEKKEADHARDDVEAGN